MPLLAILTCVLVGWVLGPKSVLDEAKRGSARFAREGLFVIMLRFVCPVLLALVFLKAFGFFA